MPSIEDHFEQIKALLSSAQPQVELPAALHDRLLQSGAVQALLEDGSQGAIELLESSARSCPAPDAARQSSEALLALALRGDPAARASLFRLALEGRLEQPVEWIRQQHLKSPLAWQNRCFAFLHFDLPEYLDEDPHLEKLLRIYLREIPATLRERLAAHAAHHGLNHWVEIARGLAAASDAALTLLIDHFHGYTRFEKEQVRFWLMEFAAGGSQPAQNGLCLLFLVADDGEAGNVALDNNYLPGEITQKALFLFLSEQWAAYEVLDFTHQQLNAAYEKADPGLRQRILSHSRLSGHTEWLQSLGDARRRRWLKDMNDADWRAVLYQFESGQSWSQAWRMIIHAPPAWSAHLVNMLYSAGWRPESQAEELDFFNLVSLAQCALGRAPQISSRKILKTPSVDITSVAMRADGKSLAAGGSDNRLYLWDLPSGERSGYVISSPTPGARALALSPDNQYLAAAFTDHSIRVFRIDNGHLVKTLDGHKGLIRSLFFHPDGRTLFSASFDGTLRAWRFPLGPEFARLQPEMGELFSAGIHPGSESIVIGGKQIQIWRWPQEAQIQALPSGQETTLQLSLAGALPLLAGYSADHSLRIWNLSSGRLLQQIDAGTQAVTTLALSPRGDFILSGDKEGAVNVWNVSTGELLERTQVHEKTMVGMQWFSESGFFSASQEGRLVLWDARLLTCLRQPLDSISHETLANIQAMKNEKFVSTGNKNWIVFLTELVRWKNRFDILLEDTHPIQLDEFDIEL